MTTLLIVLIVIACVVLGFFILVQKPKGGGLSGSFGGMSTQVMGVQKSGDVMEKGTWYIMILIALLSIASTFTLDLRGTPQAEPTNQQQPAQQQPSSAPAAPAQP